MLRLPQDGVPFFGRNDLWIMVDEGHFRCPNCGEFYLPFAAARRTSNGNVIPLLPYQKVVSMVDITTDQVYAFPCKWPGSHEDTWLLQQAELYAANLKTSADVEAYMSQTQVNLHTVLEKIAVPIGMRKFQWNKTTEYKLSGCPRTTTPDGKVLGWERLCSGFWGNILEAPTPGETVHVEESCQDLIAVLGGLIFAQRTLRRSMI